MVYSPVVVELLQKACAEVGDIIRVSTPTGTVTGRLMPHHEFSASDCIILKLENGYNIGLRLEPGFRVQVISKGSIPLRAVKIATEKADKPTIAVLGTGGTIASYVDYRTGAVHPALSAEELVFSVPELGEICNLQAKVLFNILSENMTVKHWQRLGREVADALNSGATGVVIPHGTDTMGYTAAALSFILQNLSGPVVLVGAQRSSDRPSSDATLNLLSAVQIALADLGEVVVLMHESVSDIRCTIHRGTKVRKMHASRRDAFQSINISPLGTVENGAVSLVQEHKRRAQGKVLCCEKMEEQVAMLQFYPGMRPELLEFAAQSHRGLVLAGTGLGHISAELVAVLRKLCAGLPVVLTTQCLFGSVNLNVYSTGRELLRAGVIPGEDMLPETAYVKLMWVLGQTSDLDEVRRLMLQNIAGEISVRRTLG